MIYSKKNGTRHSQSSHLFERLGFFHVTISGNFERFSSSNLFNQKKYLIKSEKKKLKKLKYHFLVRSTKIKNAICSYKTTLS